MSEHAVDSNGGGVSRAAKYLAAIAALMRLKANQ